jgi:prolyl oligopeptidase
MCVAGLLLGAGCSTPPPTETASSVVLFPYPDTATTNVVDVYHGVAVPDPYRWLEDDRSLATARWVAAQNHVTFSYLAQIPERPRIRNRLSTLWNYERHGIPFKRGGRYFFTRNDGLQNQSVLYTTTSLESEPAVLLDPNRLSTNGTVALSGFAVSEDGKYMAYGLAIAGSDWQEWGIREVETGNDLSDRVRWVKFSNASWSRDGQGFFYSRYDEPAATNLLKGVNYHHKLYYHRMGTPQSEDRLVYQRPDQKEWGFYGRVTDDGRFLIIHVSQGTDPKNRVFYLDLESPDAKVVELLDEFDASYDFIDNDGSVFYFRTDLDAPRGRIVAIDSARPDRAHWRELIPESTDSLENAHRVHETIIVEYLHHAASQVKFFDLAGRLVQELTLPGLGSVAGFGGRRSDTETFFAYTSFTMPTTIYRLDLTTGQPEIFRAPKVGFDPDDYETHQVFYTSKDGTRVPMFLSHRKGVSLDGQRPTLLYGYGGFRISMKPGFSVAQLVWMEMGGVYAVPNLRGGGEYGDAWHRAGTKLQKQNVFDDFIAAGEWLIVNNYTSSKKLAITGGSNGGLLVGACLTQRPGLFAAALPAVGVLDMLRFHKFTIGWAWTSDYGCADNPGEFKALYAYSPLHNLRPGMVYPATLITTADHDDRVVPAHSFKFAAALQAAHAGRTPVLIRIETQAGHGAGKPMSKIIDETADRWAFLVHELGIELPEAGP